MFTKQKTDYNPPELKYRKTNYAQSANDALPRQYFVGAFLGPRGSGKTYTACQLIKSYEESPPRQGRENPQEVRTIIISPTYDANECFKSLKSLAEEDVHRTYDRSVLEGILEDIEKEKMATDQYHEELKVWHKWQKARKPEDMKMDELMMLESWDFEEPEKPKYPNGCSIFLVVDDMVGSEIFKSGKNPFLNLLLRNRHHRINIMIMSQHIKSIPRAIRGNVSVWFIAKFGSRSILPDLYEECGSALLREDQFNDMYDEATSEPYGALCIDFTQPKERRFTISFHTILSPNK